MEEARMASQLGARTGGSSSRRSGGGHGRRSAAAAKQLLSRLVRSTWRQRSAARPGRRPAVRSFVYDLQSYSQNFDDGLASDGHTRFQ